MLQTYTSSRASPIAAIMRSRSCPAAPTNGKPCASSSAPGPSPTKHTPELPVPRANTVCFRPAWSAQRSHPRTVSASTSSARRRSAGSVGTWSGAVAVTAPGPVEARLAGARGATGRGAGGSSTTLGGAASSGSLTTSPPDIPKAKLARRHSSCARKPRTRSGRSSTGDPDSGAPVGHGARPGRGEARRRTRSHRARRRRLLDDARRRCLLWLAYDFAPGHPEGEARALPLELRSQAADEVEELLDRRP